MAKKRNKVKFGLSNVHWAKIIQWGEDSDGNKTIPAYGESVSLPGAVSLSIDSCYHRKILVSFCHRNNCVCINIHTNTSFIYIIS